MALPFLNTDEAIKIFEEVRKFHNSQDSFSNKLAEMRKLMERACSLVCSGVSNAILTEGKSDKIMLSHYTRYIFNNWRTPIQNSIKYEALALRDFTNYFHHDATFDYDSEIYANKEKDFQLVVKSFCSFIGILTNNSNITPENIKEIFSKYSNLSSNFCQTHFEHRADLLGRLSLMGSKFSEQIKALNEVVKSLKDNNPSLDKSILSKLENSFKFESENTLLKTEKEALVNDLNLLKENLKGKDDVITDEKKRNKELENQHTELLNLSKGVGNISETLNKEIEKNNNLQKKLTDLSDNIKEFEKRMAVLTNSNENLEQFKILYQKGSEENTTLISQKHKAENDLKNAKFELNTTQTDLTRWQSDYKNLETTKNNLASENSALQAKLNHKETEKNNLQEEKANLSEQIKSKEQAIRLLEQENSKLQTAKTQLEKSKADLENEKNKANDSYQKLQSAIKQWKQWSLIACFLALLIGGGAGWFLKPTTKPPPCDNNNTIKSKVESLFSQIASGNEKAKQDLIDLCESPNTEVVQQISAVNIVKQGDISHFTTKINANMKVAAVVTDSTDCKITRIFYIE